jgi:hypothetical protein
VVDCGNYLRVPFRWAHILWALLAAAACALLIAGGGGHPPPIILVPVVWVVWVTGHFALWGVRWLAVRGRIFGSDTEGEARPWPPGLIIALMGTGAASSLGLLQLVISVFFRARYPFRDAFWTIMMIAWLAHGVCFAGLLLRRAWSQWASATLCVGWALLLAWQILEAVLRGSRINAGELLLAVALVALLTALGYHIQTSEKVQAFFGRHRVHV